MRTGVEGCGFVACFGQYTEIAFLVSLFGFTQPIVLQRLGLVFVCSEVVSISAAACIHIGHSRGAFA